MSASPQPYYVQDSGTITPLERNDRLYDDVTSDPRGLVWMWEPPRKNANYVMGVDPSMGIVGWDRGNRTADDRKTDNGAIEIIRVGRGDPGAPDFIPDAQVCEFAGPVDPHELGDIANVLGRVFGGAEEEEQCLAIIEVYPGPGSNTIRRMIDKGYTNHYVWKQMGSLAPRATSSLGWTANQKSVRDLWIRSRRHILKGGLKHGSPWLVEEWTDCEIDFVRQTGQAISGHDDRVRAMNLALWAAHDWTFDIETKTVEVQEGSGTNWQASDMSLEQMHEAWEERFDEISG